MGLPVVTQKPPSPGPTEPCSFSWVTGLHKRMVPSLPSAPTEHDQLLLLSKVGLPSPSGARCPP